MTEEMPPEISEEELEVMKEELEQEQDSGYGAPQADKKDNIFKFFREILHTKDSKKVGNLTDPEIGSTRIGIRHYLNIANYARAEGLYAKDKDSVGVAEYLETKAEIIAATSMSRKGFLAQLFVTQIKKEQKLRTAPPIDKKTGWFSKKTETAQEE